jgi:HAD superfamily hydrolase (TIGR01509 family)
MGEGRLVCKAVIFDLDGTLINSLPYHFISFKDMLLEHGIRIDDRHLKKVIGMPSSDILKELKRKHRFGESVADLREERRYHYFKFLGNRDITFPGVKRMLRELRLTHKVAVATGSSLVTFTHSTDKDFQESFDAIVTINDVKRGKPHPDQLLLAAKRMRVKPDCCVMVGDSVYDGIAAKRAGMRFVGVTSGYTSRKELAGIGAVAVIRSAGRIKEVLKC